MGSLCAVRILGLLPFYFLESVLRMRSCAESDLLPDGMLGGDKDNLIASQARSYCSCCG